MTDWTVIPTHSCPFPTPVPLVPLVEVVLVSGPHRPDDARPIPVQKPQRRPATSTTRDPDLIDTRRKVSLRRPARQAPERDGRPAPQPPGYAAGAPPKNPRRLRPKRVFIAILLVLAAWLAFIIAVPIVAWNSVERVDNSPAQRPATGRGTNILLVGSDSREGLTAAEAAALGADTETEGKRTDSIMVVHVTAGGGTTAVMSIPRDSYVPIAGHGSNKINAAYAFGGAKLLTQTVEQTTGLRIDGYVEIGFGGFASIVDSVGGIDVCLTKPFKDDMVGLDLSTGCHLLSGRESLGYVRSRYTDARGDLGRAERQRQFLGALMKKAAQPSTVLIPTRYLGFTQAASAGVTIGKDTSLADAIAALQALRSVGSGDALSLMVPVESATYQTKNAGVAVKWNDKAAKELFALIRDDKPITLLSTG